MLLELSFLKASWITPFFFFFVKQSFYVSLLSGDRTSRYLGWDPVFHGLGSALSSWLTVSPDVISILTFLKSLYFPACILTCPTSMALHKWFVHLSCFTSWKTPSGPLKPLRYHPLSEDFLYADLHSLLLIWQSSRICLCSHINRQCWSECINMVYLRNCILL